MLSCQIHLQIPHKLTLHPLIIPHLPFSSQDPSSMKLPLFTHTPCVYTTSTSLSPTHSSPPLCTTTPLRPPHTSPTPIFQIRWYIVQFFLDHKHNQVKPSSQYPIFAPHNQALQTNNNNKINNINNNNMNKRKQRRRRSKHKDGMINELLDTLMDGM